MSKFQTVSIAELGLTVTGKTPSSETPEDFGAEYMFVTPSDNFDVKMMNSTLRYLSEIGVNKLRNKLLPPKSIMVTCIGSAMAKVSMNVSPCVTNQQINSIIPNQNFSSDYIYYSLKNNYKKLRNAASGSTALPLLNKTDFDLLKITIHKDLVEQKNISSFLSNLDAKIELNNKINAELEAMAKSLYDYWFVQFEFPNAKGKPYKSSGGKMVWSEELKREVPEGWEVVNLFDAMDVQYGFPFSTALFTEDNTQKPIVRIRDILSNSISIFSSEEVDVKYRLKESDLLIGMDGNFHINFWDKNGAYLNQRSVRIRSKQTYNISNFQAYFELTPHIKAREKNVSRTTVAHLSDKDLKRLFVLNAKTTNHFKPKENLDSLLKKIISNRLENQQLSSLRDWLLPMLMNGQVRVGDAVSSSSSDDRRSVSRTGKEEKEELGVVAEGK